MPNPQQFQQMIKNKRHTWILVPTNWVGDAISTNLCMGLCINKGYNRNEPDNFMKARGIDLCFVPDVHSPDNRAGGHVICVRCYYDWGVKA